MMDRADDRYLVLAQSLQGDASRRLAGDFLAGRAWRRHLVRSLVSVTEGLQVRNGHGHLSSRSALYSRGDFSAPPVAVEVTAGNDLGTPSPRIVRNRMTSEPARGADRTAPDLPSVGRLRCRVDPGFAPLLGVMGAGAAVSGSNPPPVLGKAITSRIDSAPARRAQIRSQPKAMPPWGGAPYWKASSRKPNFSCASASVSPITANTRAGCRRGGYGSSRRRSRFRCRRCRRRRRGAVAGSVSNVSSDSAVGMVKAWCTAVQAPEPTATSWSATDSNSGASTTQTNDQASCVDQPAAPADLEPRRAQQRA